MNKSVSRTELGSIELLNNSKARIASRSKSNSNSKERLTNPYFKK